MRWAEKMAQANQALDSRCGVVKRGFLEEGERMRDRGDREAEEAGAVARLWLSANCLGKPGAVEEGRPRVGLRVG